MSISITSDKRRWEAIRKRLEPKVPTELNLGYFAEDSYGSENDNLPVAQVAAWQDRGLPSVGRDYIPDRPFMSVGLRDLLGGSVYRKEFRDAYLRILNTNSGIKNEYRKLGEEIVEDMKTIITLWDTPPNSPYTAARKERGNDPLVDTGLMRDSFKAKIGNV